MSCFNGKYVTKNITESYLKDIEYMRSDKIISGGDENSAIPVDMHNSA